MSRKSGPTIGSASAPLIAPAGAEHVIFSKKLLIVIGLILLSTAVIFFSVEQAKIRKNLALGRIALAQNNNITKVANDLELAKDELQKEEDELVDMYTQWLDEDQKDLEITEEDIKELKKELSDVKNKISAKSNVLSAQEETLNDKDERLHAYQFKIQQKQGYLDQMAEILRKLDQDVPDGTGLGEEFEWDDAAFEDDAEFYEGDDDWINDEAWY